MMRTVLLTAACAAVLASGCSGKQRTQSTQPVRAPAVERDSKPASTEVATGPLRQALLQLERVHFGFDSTKLMPEARTALQKAAEKLKLHPDVYIYVDGHTDMRGTTEYNLALGENRARVAAQYLEQLGIGADRLRIVTFGKEQPLAPGASVRDHAQNRRVDFRLMRGSVEIVLEQGTLLDDRGTALVATE
jgi:peptidoglycan-associated lipoprotein